MASPHRNIPTLVGLAAEAVSNKDFETVAKTVDTPMLQKWHDAQYHRHEVAADRYLQDLEFVMNDFSAWEGETTRSVQEDLPARFKLDKTYDIDEVSEQVNKAQAELQGYFKKPRWQRKRVGIPQRRPLADFGIAMFEYGSPERPSINRGGRPKPFPKVDQYFTNGRPTV